VRLLGGPLERGLLAQLSSGLVQLVDDGLEPVVGLRDRSAVEGVGLTEISASFVVFLREDNAKEKRRYTVRDGAKLYCIPAVGWLRSCSDQVSKVVSFMMS
jgi:hypothetical protein